MPRAASRLNTLLVATLFILLAASIPRLHAQVPLTDVIDVAAGSAHACALKTDGTVVCWGGNEYGQLGNGTTTDSLVAVPVSGLNSVISIEAGLSHTCALRSDGSVFCWGHNARGQLGDGTTTTRLTPTLVSGLGASASALTAGGLHTCAITGPAQQNAGETTRTVSWEMAQPPSDGRPPQCLD
jgi:alpha-tubulin suppressor-like RCC1 family protein